jgi:ribose transport system ATP-binding protein
MTRAVRRARQISTLRAWVPLILLAAVIVGIGAYANSRSSDFLSEYNLNSLLLSALPLAFIAIGQVNALMVGAFDISVGALITMCVVVASFTMTEGQGSGTLFLGALALVGVAVAVGLVNATLIRVIRLPSIIATLATLSVLQGLSLEQRPVPGGSIDSGVTDALEGKVSFIPYAFIGVVAMAAIGDILLYRTAGGLTFRAVGFDEGSSRRLGIRSELIVWGALVSTSLLAAFGAFFWAVQQGVGDGNPSTGTNFTLQSLAAAVLGGASLVGGRGSYVGAVLGAIFLSLVVNMQPFVGWQDSTIQIMIGALLVLALVMYQGLEIWKRIRAIFSDVRRLAARPGLAGKSG